VPAKDLLGAHDFLSHALLTYKKAVLRFIPAHRVVRKQAVLHGGERHRQLHRTRTQQPQAQCRHSPNVSIM
jgi:hypothetical protein